MFSDTQRLPHTWILREAQRKKERDLSRSKIQTQRDRPGQAGTLGKRRREGEIDIYAVKFR